MAFFNPKNSEESMKRIVICMFAVGFAISVSSCRETTGEKTEEAIQAAGEDIERNTKRAAEEIERAAEEVEREIEEEMHETDDQH